MNECGYGDEGNECLVPATMRIYVTHDDGREETLVRCRTHGVLYLQWALVAPGVTAYVEPIGAMT